MTLLPGDRVPDFIPVCTTGTGRFAQRAEQADRRGVKARRTFSMAMWMAVIVTPTG